MNTVLGYPHGFSLEFLVVLATRLLLRAVRSHFARFDGIPPKQHENPSLLGLAHRMIEVRPAFGALGLNNLRVKSLHRPAVGFHLFCVGEGGGVPWRMACHICL